MLHRVSLFRRVAPSHSRLGTLRAASARRALRWQLRWMALKWLTELFRV